jgi:hypothetical protein
VDGSGVVEGRFPAVGSGAVGSGAVGSGVVEGRFPAVGSGVVEGRFPAVGSGVVGSGAVVVGTGVVEGRFPAVEVVVVGSAGTMGVVLVKLMTVTTGADTPVLFNEDGSASVRPVDTEPETSSSIVSGTTTAVSTSIVAVSNRRELDDTSTIETMVTLDISNPKKVAIEDLNSSRAASLNASAVIANEAVNTTLDSTIRGKQCVALVDPARLSCESSQL